MERILETTDLDVAADIFSSEYTGLRMRVDTRNPLLRVAQHQLGRARLDHTTFGMALEGNADPVDQIMICHIRSGTVHYTVGDTELSYGPGDTCFPLQPGREWSTALRDVDSAVIVLDQALLDETAGRPARLLSDRPRTGSAASQLWRIADAVRTSVAAQPDAEQHPLVVASAARLLAASVLATFPNTAMIDPTIEERHDSHTDTLRRATTFIETYPDRDLSVADIAEAAFVTVRAVQLAFRRHLDTTPMAYLRRVRLHHAHEDLLAAEPYDGQSVSSIAARWGFFSPSRFAANYKREYGEAPGTTLRR
jgi:AraC-like DNA-binding protein